MVRNRWCSTFKNNTISLWFMQVGTWHKRFGPMPMFWIRAGWSAPLLPLITKQIFILASLWSWTDRYPNSQDKFSRGIHNLCLRAAMILPIKLIHFKCMRQIYVLYIMYCCEIKFLFCSVCYTISKSSDQPAQSDQSLASRIRILLTEHHLQRLSWKGGWACRSLHLCHGSQHFCALAAKGKVLLFQYEK